MMPTIKESLNDYYKDYSLSEDQFEVLDRLETEHCPRSRLVSSRKGLWVIPALAAGVLFVVLTAPENNSLEPGKIAGEIAYNHNKTLSLEFEGHSFNEIKPHFSKLDFNLVSSNNRLMKKARLLGGRYCSINNKLAAQIRLQRQGKAVPVTWYQLPISNDQADIRRLKLTDKYETYSGGVKVIIWTEKGVLHGLAGDID